MAFFSCKKVHRVLLHSNKKQLLTLTTLYLRLVFVDAEETCKFLRQQEERLLIVEQALLDATTTEKLWPSREQDEENKSENQHSSRQSHKAPKATTSCRTPNAADAMRTQQLAHWFRSVQNDPKKSQMVHYIPSEASSSYSATAATEAETEQRGENIDGRLSLGQRRCYRSSLLQSTRFSSSSRQLDAVVVETDRAANGTFVQSVPATLLGSSPTTTTPMESSQLLTTSMLRHRLSEKELKEDIKIVHVDRQRKELLSQAEMQTPAAMMLDLRANMRKPGSAAKQSDTNPGNVLHGRLGETNVEALKNPAPSETKGESNTATFVIGDDSDDVVEGAAAVPCQRRPLVQLLSKMDDDDDDDEDLTVATGPTVVVPRLLCRETSTRLRNDVDEAEESVATVLTTQQHTTNLVSAGVDDLSVATGPTVVVPRLPCRETSTGLRNVDNDEAEASAAAVFATQQHMTNLASTRVDDDEDTEAMAPTVVRSKPDRSFALSRLHGVRRLHPSCTHRVSTVQSTVSESDAETSAPHLHLKASNRRVIAVKRPQAVAGSKSVLRSPVGRPSHIELDMGMPSPTPTNITMDTALGAMNDTFENFGLDVSDGPGPRNSKPTSILDRYRLKKDDDSPNGFKVVPNTFPTIDLWNNPRQRAHALSPTGPSTPVWRRSSKRVFRKTPHPRKRVPTIKEIEPFSPGESPMLSD